MLQRQSTQRLYARRKLVQYDAVMSCQLQTLLRVHSSTGCIDSEMQQLTGRLSASLASCEQVPPLRSLPAAAYMSRLTEAPRSEGARCALLLVRYLRRIQSASALCCLIYPAERCTAAMPCKTWRFKPSPLSSSTALHTAVSLSPAMSGGVGNTRYLCSLQSVLPCAWAAPGPPSAGSAPGSLCSTCTSTIG